MTKLKKKRRRQYFHNLVRQDAILKAPRRPKDDFDKRLNNKNVEKKQTSKKRYCRLVGGSWLPKRDGPGGQIDAQEYRHTNR